MEEDVGGGLGVRDVGDAEDAALEAWPEAGQPERQAHLVVGAARGDTTGQRDRVEGGNNARDSVQIPL
jgi:hypothetical protein